MSFKFLFITFVVISRIDVITLQETWFDDEMNLSLYQLEGFDLINIPRRLSKHDSLIMYIKNTFSYSLCDLIPESDVFEGVFITVQNKQNLSLKYIIGDIYRPSHDKVNELEQFIEEFNLITQTFEELNYRACLCGDYKIGLLQIDNSDKINLFYKNLIMSSFCSKITLPTRPSETTCTLIDNVIIQTILNVITYQEYLLEKFLIIK